MENKTIEELIRTIINQRSIIACYARFMDDINYVPDHEIEVIDQVKILKSELARDDINEEYNLHSVCNAAIYDILYSAGVKYSEGETLTELRESIEIPELAEIITRQKAVIARCKRFVDDLIYDQDRLYQNSDNIRSLKQEFESGNITQFND